MNDRCFQNDGFTLLEVMIAVAIMAGVILTLLSAVNYHLSIVARERDDTELTLLARVRLTELETADLKQKSEGSFAPARPELLWRADIIPSSIPVLNRLVIRVRDSGDGREVTLERYILK